MRKFYMFLFCLLFLAGCKDNVPTPNALQSSGTTSQTTMQNTTENVAPTTEIATTESRAGDDTSAVTTTAADTTTVPPATDTPVHFSGDVPFSLVSAVRVSEKDADNFAAYLIETKAALDTYGIEGTDTYTNTYFETKSLLLLCVTLESGSMELKIDRLARDGTALTVHYTTVEPYVQTADMAYRRLLLEVDRADVSGIASIVGERQRAAQAGTTVSP